MKNLFWLIVFSIVINLQSNAQNPCHDPTNYAPNIPEQTPIKRVRVVIHVVQNSADTGNFQNTQIDKQKYFQLFLLKNIQPNQKHF